MRLTLPALTLPALSLLFLVFSSPVQAEEASPRFPENFSGNVRMKAMGQDVKAKFAKLGAMTRMEMDFQGMRSVTIIDSAAQTMYNLQPAQKVAIKITNPAISRDPMSELAKGNIKLRKIGPEKVNDVEAVKYETTTEGGQPILIWMDDQQMPVRLSTPNGMVDMMFSDVVVEKPEASLFEVPQDYQIQEMPIPSPGSMPGGGSPAPAAPPQ